MNLSILFDLTIGALITFFSAQGNQSAINALTKLSHAKNSGVYIDSHMQTIADDLKAGVEPNWSDLEARIDSEVSEFLSRDSTGQVPDGSPEPT